MKISIKKSSTGCRWSLIRNESLNVDDELVEI